MATAAPTDAGGPRAAVAEPSAFAFASVLAEDQIVIPGELIDHGAGRLALDVVFVMFTATAAATATAPLDELAGGVLVEPEPVVALFVATASPRLRWFATCVVTGGVPESAAPFALASAFASVADAPVALNSTVPATTRVLPVVAVTECSARLKATTMPTAAFVPVASPVADVAAVDERSVARTTRLPPRVSVTSEPIAAPVVTLEKVTAATGTMAVPPLAPPVAVVATVWRLVESRVRSSATTVALSP